MCAKSWKRREKATRREAAALGAARNPQDEAIAALSLRTRTLRQERFVGCNDKLFSGGLPIPNEPGCVICGGDIEMSGDFGIVLPRDRKYRWRGQ